MQFNIVTVCMYIDLYIAKLCNLILSEDGFEIKSKYNNFNHFLFLTRVLSLQDVFRRDIFVLYFIKLSSG